MNKTNIFFNFLVLISNTISITTHSPYKQKLFGILSKFQECKQVPELKKFENRSSRV